MDLTNKGSSACTMEGYPGVDLVGAAVGQENFSWPMTRGTYVGQTHLGVSLVTLRPGGTAHFDLPYLPIAGGDGNKPISVAKMVITPPNDYAHGEVTWHQTVILQDAATHPGTYITPVQPGS